MIKKRLTAVLSLALLLTGCGRMAATSAPAPTETLTPFPAGTPTPESAFVAERPYDTWVRPTDGMEMVFVPAGDFLMGSTEANHDAEGDEVPQHSVYLDAFWIDKTEVTNAQYAKCVEAGACTRTWCWEHGSFNAPDQPVACALWNNAHDYATWVGGRLATEAEWEKAARGTDRRRYPWGNSAPDCEKANFGGCFGVTTRVGSHPAGASPYGALDMAGNVSEWVVDRYDEGYYARSPARNPRGPDAGAFRVMRGGSFIGDERSLRCANRYRGSPKHRPWWYGFRVVVDLDT
jgi:formylglycine-generating enzyme required for sulfatase activity